MCETTGMSTESTPNFQNLTYISGSDGLEKSGNRAESRRRNNQATSKSPRH